MFGQSKTPFTFNFSSPSTQAGSTQAAGQTGAPAQTTTTTGGGLFGSTQPSTTTTISGSGSFSLSGGFGQAKSTATFGQPASAQPTTSLFGSPFGAKPASSTTTLGSGFGTTPALGSTSAFGTSFGQQASTSTGSTGFPAIAQQPQQPIAQQQITPEVFTSALTNAQVFNDERDAILTKWNQLQACYGFGKLFFQNNSIDVDKDNRYNRFKTIGYSCKPSTRNEDGLVCLIINQKEEMVKTNQKSISDSLHKIFNSDQALIIKIETIKPIEESRTELIFYITKRTSALNEQGERVPAMMVFEHLNKQEPPSGMMSLKTTPSVRQQLEQLNVVHFYPLVGLNDDQVKAYLETPPSGKEMRLL
jgi:nuclear pore complex protein Nup54